MCLGCLYVFGMFVCVWDVCMCLGCLGCLYVFGMFVCVWDVCMCLGCLYAFGMFVRGSDVGWYVIYCVCIIN